MLTLILQTTPTVMYKYLQKYSTELYTVKTRNLKVIWEGLWYLKLPISYSGVPHICPQNYSLLWTSPETHLPASSLYPSDLPSQAASIYDQPLPQCTRQTDTHRHTDQHMVGGNVWWL